MVRRRSCRTSWLYWRKLKSGRLFGYLARRPGNRATTARCPRGRAGTPSVQVVGVRRRHRRNGEQVDEQEVSATDTALRQRIHQLGVHIPCGGIRGPVGGFGPRRWQSCQCEDNPEKWYAADVSREKDLCIICFRATAGGVSRYSWLACEDCRAVNAELPRRYRVRPFPLGRHSFMNGIAVRGGAPPDVQREQLARLQAFARGDDRLRSWRRAEYGRLAVAFDPLADVPLCEWQQQWPPGRQASVDAFSRLVGHDLRFV